MLQVLFVLCVGYKIKTCTQISDSGFRGEINVVSLSDSAKRASRVGGLAFPCKREVKSSLPGKSKYISYDSPLKRSKDVPKTRSCFFY